MVRVSARNIIIGKKVTPFLISFGLLLVLITFSLAKPISVFAQITPTGAPFTNTAVWEFDPVVTEVGKNADRARQLLWWIFQHPGIHTAPVIASIWAVSRNVVYIFIVLVIIAFGLSLILGRRKGTIGPIFSGISSPVFGLNIPMVFIRIAAILLYATFSYIVIVAMIQISDIIMRFFIETVGGKDLFNVIFAGAGNSEANYITFVGYKDINPLSLEMINTSIFMIKLTSFTYNVMTVTLVLRTIILWFLLIVAPFLALLMPFVFIRNIGWIWIGVFFQWLFYGPLFALFLASLTKIWVYGIPYGFNFDRVNTPSGQVYRTAINILWGGPAQTLSPGNSANYVDTYAEYVIALIMLWAAIILPWLLLRIFRDYCCSMIATSANTLNSIFDRLRQYPPPPPPSPIVPTTTGMAAVLPFRQRIEEKVKEVEKIRIEDIKDVSRVSTNELVKSMDLSVSKLSDVSRFETNVMKRNEVMQSLNKIRAPEQIAHSLEREKYMQVKEELVSRAAQGDIIAKTVIQASDSQTRVMAQEVTRMKEVREEVLRQKGVPTAVSVTAPAVQPITNVISATEIDTISQQVGISPVQVREVLTQVVTNEVVTLDKLKKVSSQTNLSNEKVKEITRIAQRISLAKSLVSIVSSEQIKVIAKEQNLSESTIKEILFFISATEQVTQEKIKEVSEKTKVEKDKVEGVITKARKPAVKKEITPAISVEDYEEVKQMWLQHYRSAPVPVSETITDRLDWLDVEEKQLTNIFHLLSSSNIQLRQQGLEKVAEILPFMLLGGFSDSEIMTYIKAKLEADKQVKQECEIEQKAKEKAKEEFKEEETMVEVEAKKEKEEKKKSLEESQSKPIPEEEGKSK